MFRAPQRQAPAKRGIPIPIAIFGIKGAFSKALPVYYTVMDRNRHSKHPVYALTRPESRPAPIVFSSPHSGRDYPTELLLRTHLDRRTLRSSEDAFVDELFATAPDYGAHLIAAHLPRAWVDLNRSASELDPALVSGAPRAPRSPRINAGLGVIPRVVSEARVIMHGKIALTEAVRRIERYHRPYHDALDALLREARAQWGHAVLFDCHSMPHDALAGAPRVNGFAPDIVLGDRFGAACDRSVMEQAAAAFTDAGFRVARNAPFAGGYITQTYGRPMRGIHALQIEIDRRLYMDERRIERSRKFRAVAERLDSVIAQLCRVQPDSVSLAAE